LKRREFITLLGGCGVAAMAGAQQSKLPTLGFLGTSTPVGWAQWTAALIQRLHELG
jgi:hypothetical protein